jgi:hypothetical protein
MSKDDGVVSIHGKAYKTVARRVADFREMDAYIGWSLSTEVLERGDTVLIKASIFDENGVCISTGHGEEVRGSTNINKTSALENAETSAIGRALAFLSGDLAGTEIASADEVANAIAQQKESEQVDRLKAHMLKVKEHYQSIAAMKEALALGDYDAAYEAYLEIPNDDKQVLAVAPTKGGIWEIEEYKQLRSDEFGAARKRYHGLDEDAA